MTTEQAIQILTAVTENIALTRAQHAQVAQALATLQNALAPKKVEPIVKAE